MWAIDLAPVKMHNVTQVWLQTSQRVKFKLKDDSAISDITPCGDISKVHNIKVTYCKENTARSEPSIRRWKLLCIFFLIITQPATLSIAKVLFTQNELCYIVSCEDYK